MPEIVRLNVSTRSGKVHVIAEPGAWLTVEGGTVVGQHEDAYEIRRDPDASTIVVRVAPQSEVTIGTVSGDITVEGALGAVRIATVSGKVRVEEAARVDVRAKSGRIEIGECHGECRVVVTSSKTRIGRAGRLMIAGVSGSIEADGVAGADVKTVSGKVELTTTAAGHIAVRTVSGKVAIRVPSSVQPATRLKSVSGKVRCDCRPGVDGEIAVATVSGAIQVSCE